MNEEVVAYTIYLMFNSTTADTLIKDIHKFPPIIVVCTTNKQKAKAHNYTGSQQENSQ